MGIENMENIEREQPFDQEKWREVTERYTRMWLESRSGIPKSHSWNHMQMVAQESPRIGKMLGANEEELEAIFIAGLGHDAIQPGLVQDEKLIEKMEEEWDYDPDGDEAIESAKATKYVISNESWQKRHPISQEMIDRITNAIAGHGFRIGPGGTLEYTDDKDKKFNERDVIERSLYIADKIVNQEPTIFFAFCNFTPYENSNKRPFADLDVEDIPNFMNLWFKKREHLLEDPELAEWLEKADPQIENKIKYLKEVIDEFNRELAIMKDRPDLKDFIESYGVMAIIRPSQERGRDTINKGDFEIARGFIDYFEKINQQESIGDDAEKRKIFNFVQDFVKRLKEVLNKYEIK